MSNDQKSRVFATGPDEHLVCPRDPPPLVMGTERLGKEKLRGLAGSLIGLLSIEVVLDAVLLDLAGLFPFFWAEMPCRLPLGLPSLALMMVFCVWSLSFNPCEYPEQDRPDRTHFRHAGFVSSHFIRLSRHTPQAPDGLPVLTIVGKSEAPQVRRTHERLLGYCHKEQGIREAKTLPLYGGRVEPMVEEQKAPL